MPTAAKGARLWLRPESGTRKSVWIIRDGKQFVSTGCSPDEREAAEQRLAAYIVEKHKPSRDSDRSPAEISVADVVQIYIEDKASGTARPQEVGQRMVKVLGFFGSKKLSEINGPLCRAYARKRGSQAAARRELEDLRAAIRYHHSEGLCSELIPVVLPEKSPPRERWMTRSEAARLLWTAWRSGQGKRKHVARFILVGLYTGTRASAICQAAMRPTVGRGYVDLEHGVFYRRAAGERQTKKRRPPVRLHPRLLAHLRRWQEKGLVRNAIVEWKGKPIGRMAKAFRHNARDAKLSDVTPHILRHTAITWAMQNGADKYETAGFFGVTLQVIEDVYAHHHPDQGGSVNRAIGAKKKAHTVRQAVC